jgi:hypothetical protein
MGGRRSSRPADMKGAGSLDGSRPYCCPDILKFLSTSSHQSWGSSQISTKALAGPSAELEAELVCGR